jgi:hypothetical protein
MTLRMSLEQKQRITLESKRVRAKSDVVKEFCKVGLDKYSTICFVYCNDSNSWMQQDYKNQLVLFHLHWAFVCPSRWKAERWLALRGSICWKICHNFLRNKFKSNWGCAFNVKYYYNDLQKRFVQNSMIFYIWGELFVAKMTTENICVD